MPHLEQRHHPQVAGATLKSHDFLKGNGNTNGGNHEGLRCVANERCKNVGGGKLAKRGRGKYCQCQGYGKYDGRVVASQKTCKARINRRKCRIHGKIAKRQEYLVGEALHHGKGHRQRHVKACQRAGIQELLQPIAKFMGGHLLLHLILRFAMSRQDLRGTPHGTAKRRVEIYILDLPVMGATNRVELPIPLPSQHSLVPCNAANQYNPATARPCNFRQFPLISRWQFFIGHPGFVKCIGGR